MKSDEGFSDMLNKTILIDYLNENVITINLKQKFKRGSFYCPFFFKKNQNIKLLFQLFWMSYPIER
jgi:hypothetical protein